jgi:hypothetical protein
MLKYIIATLMIFITSAATAHEMVPTYPRLVPSYVDGVYRTTIQLFNKRADVEYYEFGVFDKDFKPIPFVTAYTVIKVEYLAKVTVDVFIRKTDINRATYICSQSKLRKADIARTAVSSRICSKFESARK